MHSQGKTFLMRVVLLIIYGLAGAGIFILIEKREESYKATSKRMLQQLKKNFTKHSNMSDEEFETFAIAAYQAIRVGVSLDWTYFRAVDFIYSAMTTIGYGHITPVTTAGKLFCVVFCLFGIPICLLTLKTAGELISSLLTGAIIHFERKVFKTQAANHVEIKCAVVTFVLMVVYISLASVVQVILENWSFSDAFYAWFISFTTVGFGDYIPFESVVPREDSIAAAIFHIAGTFPAIFGLCLTASVINALFRVFDGDERQKCSSFSCCEHSKSCGRKNLANGNLQIATETDPGVRPLHTNRRPCSV